MENRTKGAWIINHTKKLQEFDGISNFEDIQLAGKCGQFLINLAATKEPSTLSKSRVDVIAENVLINKRIELPTIIKTLKDQQLIDISASGDISVIGITSSSTLLHTANIFNYSGNDYQNAAIELSNYVSDKPIDGILLKEYISDTYKLAKNENDNLFIQAEEIGFVDYEDAEVEKIYFNGNLFKHDDITKTTKVLSSLNPKEVSNIQILDEKIIKEGCVEHEFALTLLGSTLLNKLKAIAMYDFNEVKNETDIKIYLTKPSSFAKFGDPFEEDILDLAKAFIASLIYGLQVSNSKRGKIVDYIMLQNTLKKLLRGEEVGPCTAIGQDYHYLEINRVISLRHDIGSKYFMRLLKYDVANVALEVIQNGEIAEQTTIGCIKESSTVSMYKGPEEIRSSIRRKKRGTVKPDICEQLRTMR